MGQTLRDYQVAACDEVEKDSDNIILCGPTGCGKTTIIAEIVKRAVTYRAKHTPGSPHATVTHAPKRVLLMAHRRELIYQPVARMVRHGVPPECIGVIMGAKRKGAQGHVEPWMTDAQLFRAVARTRRDALVHVASVQTLVGRNVPTVDIILIDEGHRTGAKTYQRIIEKNPSAKVVALTATPDRSDHSLHKTFKRIVTVATYRQLAAKGYLVIPRCFGRDSGALNLAAVPLARGDYKQDALADAVDKPALVGDIVTHWRERSNGAPTLVFATGVKHSKHIADQFNAAGIKAMHVDGETPADRREKAFADLATGAVQVVTNAEVATEGLDVPAVKCVILARPTKSLRIYLQQVGRGSRPVQGAPPFVVLDHAGIIEQEGFGLPHNDRTWSLEPPKAKRKAKPGEEPVLAAKRCPECGGYNALSAGTCEQCGHEFPKRALEHVEGELVEYRELSDFELRARWNALLVEWKALPKRLPARWVIHTFARRYGAKPPHGARLFGDSE